MIQVLQLQVQLRHLELVPLLLGLLEVLQGLEIVL
jgi:hypothetical protein